jgi:hypothetical protein
LAFIRTTAVRIVPSVDLSVLLGYSIVCPLIAGAGQGTHLQRPDSSDLID